MLSIFAIAHALFALKYLPSNVADQSVAAAAVQNAKRNVEPLSVDDRVLWNVAV